LKFTVELSGADGAEVGQHAIETVNIRASSATDPAPQASDSNINATAGKTYRGRLVATDPQAEKLTYTIVTRPTRGKLKLINKTSGQYGYSADRKSEGADSFTWRGTNEDGNESNIGTVDISIKPASTGHPTSPPGPGRGGSNSGGGGSFGLLTLLLFAGLGQFVKRRCSDRFEK
jgi:hypothetical protein